jgi:hypothetical protein
MGLFSHLIAYQFGKRRGKRKAKTVFVQQDNRSPKCVNYYSFCLNYGSCDGMECEYE